MVYYSYEEFDKDIRDLAKKIDQNFKPDAFVAIARGGLTAGHFLATILKSRNIFALNSVHYDDTKKLNEVEIFNMPDLSSYKKVVLVDDMIDSGESMVEIYKVLTKKYPKIEFKIATLFFKERALIKPDFTVKEANEWIEFFWENDTFESKI